MAAAKLIYTLPCKEQVYLDKSQIEERYKDYAEEIAMAISKGHLIKTDPIEQTKEYQAF